MIIVNKVRVKKRNNICLLVALLGTYHHQGVNAGGWSIKENENGELITNVPMKLLLDKRQKNNI